MRLVNRQNKSKIVSKCWLKNLEYTAPLKYILQSHKDEPIACPDEDDLKEMDNLSIGFYKLRLLTAN